jgi:hypothetical protein
MSKVDDNPVSAEKSVTGDACQEHPSVSVAPIPSGAGAEQLAQDPSIVDAPASPRQQPATSKEQETLGDSTETAPQSPLSVRGQPSDNHCDERHQPPGSDNRIDSDARSSEPESTSDVVEPRAEVPPEATNGDEGSGAVQQPDARPSNTASSLQGQTDPAPERTDPRDESQDPKESTSGGGISTGNGSETGSILSRQGNGETYQVAGDNITHNYYEDARKQMLRGKVVTGDHSKTGSIINRDGNGPTYQSAGDLYIGNVVATERFDEINKFSECSPNPFRSCPPAPKDLPVLSNDDLGFWAGRLQESRLILIECLDQDVAVAAAHGLVERLGVTDPQRRLSIYPDQLTETSQDGCDIKLFADNPHNLSPDSVIVVDLMAVRTERGMRFLDSFHPTNRAWSDQIKDQLGKEKL